MPSATPKQDVSVSWPRHAECGYVHMPGATWACPRAGVWLVASICRHCSPSVYCKAHGQRVR